MLYYTEKNTWIKKKKSLIFKTKNANSRLFGAWLPRVFTTNDIALHNIPRSKQYSMVIFPAAFIFLAYEGYSALNHMLTWYKVICHWTIQI